MLLNVSGYMDDKVAISLTFIFGKAFNKRLIYKSLNIIAFFAHLKWFFIYFLAKRDEVNRLCFKRSSPATKRLGRYRRNASNVQALLD